MDVEKVLCIVGGTSEISYAANSAIPRKALLRIRPMLEEALAEIYRNLHPEKMTVADLGCASGPNTLLLLSEVIRIISNQCLKMGQQPPEMLFFLNNLCNNDFNSIFQSLHQVKESVRMEKGVISVPYFVAGLPASFYGQLLPRQSVHFFHSTFSLHWISQVYSYIGDKKNGMALNKGNIYIGKTGPLLVGKLYQEQFRSDFSHFLKLRCDELVLCGQMVLSFLGRNKKDILDGEWSIIWGLLAESLDSMVQEGLVEEENVDTFNLPFYTPSAKEVEAIINLQGLFDIIHFQTFESNMDPFDNLDDDVVLDNVQSGANCAKAVRSVIELMIASHFGSTIVDDLFSRYATNVAKHLLKEKLKFTILALSLKKNGIDINKVISFLNNAR